MNNNRRKAIGRILDDLEGLIINLDYIIYKEQKSYCNTPESIRKSMLGGRRDEILILLSAAIENIDDARDNLILAIE